VTYQYRILSQSEEIQSERSLAEFAAQVCCLQLRIDKPMVRFIDERADGFINFKSRVDGYCPPPGKEIFIRSGLSPAALVNTAVHECRHAWQWQTAAWRNKDESFCEGDAKTFTHEFWADHSRSGYHAELMGILGDIKVELVKSRFSHRQAEIQKFWIKPGQVNCWPPNVEFS